MTYSKAKKSVFAFGEIGQDRVGFTTIGQTVIVVYETRGYKRAGLPPVIGDQEAIQMLRSQEHITITQVRDDLK